MNRTEELLELASQRILVLDGAMGTMIQRHKLDEAAYRGEEYANHPDSLQGNNDLLSITQPQIILDIHRAYFEAGADLVETNTFNANRISQADYNLESEVRKINIQSAKLAKQAAEEYSTPEKPRFVVGSMGPTNRTASISPDVNNPGFRAVSFDDLVEIYDEQVEALLEGGVDLLMVETVFDTLNAKAALFAIEEVFERRGQKVPIMVSGTITDASGRTLSGQTAEAFLISLEHIPLLSIGLNCALGAKQLRPYVQTLSEKAPFLVSAHPNAGLPNAFGEYDETADQMGEQIEQFLSRDSVNIIGGCCGTTPEHIATIAELASRYSPRQASILEKQI
ncbi:MAG: homocysteine S-methyltransferase family protein [Flavobacteriia bacterium]|nr:homocysteine S-methyltransferase family protein [Flavobacteriia bacterium]